MALLFGCKTRKIAEINCDSYINGLEKNHNYKNYEDCLIDKSIKTRTKEQLYSDIKGTLIAHGMYAGYSVEISQSYLSSKALTKILTDKELAINLRSKDSGIKYNSFYSIAKRNNQNVFESLKFVLSDTTRVHSQYGCLIDELTFADLCINLVMGIEPNEETYRLNEVEVSQLDSLEVARNLKLGYRELMNR